MQKADLIESNMKGNTHERQESTRQTANKQDTTATTTNLLKQIIEQEVKSLIITRAIVQRGYMKENDLIKETMSLAMQMDSNHKRYHRKSRKIMLEERKTYEQSLAIAASILKAAMIFCEKEEDIMLESDLMREETAISIKQALDFVVEMYL